MKRRTSALQSLEVAAFVEVDDGALKAKDRKVFRAGKDALVRYAQGETIVQIERGPQACRAVSCMHCSSAAVPHIATAEPSAFAPWSRTPILPSTTGSCRWQRRVVVPLVRLPACCSPIHRCARGSTNMSSHNTLLEAPFACPFCW